MRKAWKSGNIQELDHDKADTVNCCLKTIYKWRPHADEDHILEVHSPSLHVSDLLYSGT